MIKYKAFSIAPAEVEGLQLEHPAVQYVAVIGIPDEEVGEITKGFVILRSGQQVTDVIPKLASSKILRRELKERERARKNLA